MAIYIYPNNQIAAGNNNTGGLVAWESITPTSDKPFLAPVLFGKLVGGETAIRADGSVYKRGYPVVFGEFGAITQAQVFYLYNTFCGGGYSGPITAKLRLLDPNTYVSINATLVLPDLNSQKKVGLGYQNFKFQYARVVLI